MVDGPVDASAGFNVLTDDRVAKDFKIIQIIARAFPIWTPEIRAAATKLG